MISSSALCRGNVDAGDSWQIESPQAVEIKDVHCAALYSARKEAAAGPEDDN